MARERTVEEENEIAAARELQRTREVQQAFVALFGLPGSRTPHGKIVLDALERKFQGAVGAGGRSVKMRLPTNHLGADGHTDPYLTMRKLGHYDVLEAIHNIIEWRESDNVHASSPST